MKKLLLCVTFMVLPLITACSSRHEENSGDKKHEMGSVEEHSDIHWGYEGAGDPQHWGDLKMEFATCKTGQSQSPINIQVDKVARADLPAIGFRYQAVPLAILNNGHTIQVNYPAGSSVKVGDESYELPQFHFHTPSEHTVDGKPFAMVAHLVHKTANGGLGVVGVLMKEGASNPVIESLWKVMPRQAGGEVQVADVTVDASELLPQDHSYYNYSGSLTTPPCSESVNWMVLKNPVEVSGGQVLALAELFKNNARPTQSLYDRVVTAN